MGTSINVRGEIRYCCARNGWGKKNCTKKFSQRRTERTNVLTGSGVVNGVMQFRAEHDVIENVDHEAREEQVTHVEHRLVVFVRYRLVHERVTSDEIQYGI